MNDSNYLKTYKDFILFERRLSEHTVKNYFRDINLLMQLNKGESLSSLKSSNIRTSISSLHAKGLSSNSLSRIISAWKSLFVFLIDQHKFTVRFYVVAVGGRLMRYEDSVVFIHGMTYAPNDANHASQVDNRSYRDAGSLIKLVPGSQTTHAGALTKAAAALTADMTGLLDEVRMASVMGASGESAFAVLALDALLTRSGELKLLRIHTFPNFITTAQIDAEVHVPLFEDVLRVMADIPGRKLVTITD